MREAVSPEHFSFRAKLKLRLILLASLLCQLAVFAALFGMLASPYVIELAHISPWVFTAAICGGLLALLGLVLLYASIYYAAEREAYERRKRDQTPPASGDGAERPE